MNLSTNQDVLIIGGGIIGLSIARKLHQKGLRKITIVERGRVGRESSFAAAGMLAAQALKTSFGIGIVDLTDKQVNLQSFV